MAKKKSSASKASKSAAPKMRFAVGDDITMYLVEKERCLLGDCTRANGWIVRQIDTVRRGYWISHSDHPHVFVYEMELKNG